jgi:hypothetical protein
MVILRNGERNAGAEGKELSLREQGERAKRAAYASIQRISQAPRTSGVAEKEISDYIIVLEGMKKEKTEKLGSIQERAAGERMGRVLLLQGEIRRLEHTMALISEEIGLLHQTSEVVEKMEERIKTNIDFVSDDVAQKTLCSGEAQTLGAKIIRLTNWLSQRNEMTIKEDKDIIGEIAYLKAYLGIRTAEM